MKLARNYQIMAFARRSSKEVIKPEYLKKCLGCENV